MKLLKKKELWYSIGIILAIIVASILFFFPDVIDGKYPYSYENLREKDVAVQGLNSELIQKESNIKSELESLSQLENESKLKRIEAEDIKSGINESDFQLDIPSVLIDLEQNALIHKVELNIKYNNIAHIDGGNNPEMIEENPDEGSPDNDKPNDKEDPKKDETSKPEEQNKDNEKPKDNNEIKVTEENKENEISKEELIANSSRIQGINVTVIPIDIKGNYNNVRSYIKYLDKIGMIEPSSVKLTSMGNSIEGSVVLNVFHGEVGL